MKFEEYTFTIGAHYLSALIDGDETGLSDAESEELASWLRHVIETNIGTRNHHWSPTDNENEFGRCEITGERGAVEGVTLCVEVRS